MNLSPDEIAREQADIHGQKSTTTIGVTVAFGFVALGFVLTRLGYRVRSQKIRLGLDDGLLAIGMLSTAILIMASCVQSWYAIGRHIITIQPEDIVINGKWQLVSGYSYVFALTFTKLSILALLVRVFTLDRRWFRLAIYGTAFYLFLWFVGMILLVSLICRPISRWWSVTDSCGPSFLSGWVSGIFNIISDIILIVLPQPLLWKLQMSFRKRLAVSAVFLTGSVATIISVLRIPFLEGTFLGNPEDATYNGFYAIIFSCLEPTIGIICACMPTMPHVFRSVAANMSNVFSTSRRRLGASKSSLPGASRGEASDGSLPPSQRSGSGSGTGSGQGIRVDKTIDVFEDSTHTSREAQRDQYELTQFGRQN